MYNPYYFNYSNFSSFVDNGRRLMSELIRFDFEATKNFERIGDGLFAIAQAINKLADAVVYVDELYRNNERR